MLTMEVFVSRNETVLVISRCDLSPKYRQQAPQPVLCIQQFADQVAPARRPGKLIRQVILRRGEAGPLVEQVN